MFAHKIVGLGGPDDVMWQEADEPARDGGVIIDVVAAGVSFADLLQTRGAYQMRTSATILTFVKRRAGVAGVREVTPRVPGTRVTSAAAASGKIRVDRGSWVTFVHHGTHK